jgi:PAS domain S-box-containing protein
VTPDRPELERAALAILEATTDLVGITDEGGRTLFLSASGRALLGLDPQADLNGVHLATFLPDPAARILVDEGLPAARDSGRWSTESALRRSHGGEIPVWILVLSHLDSKENVAFHSVVARDLSERRDTEVRLRERMKELGTLYAITRVAASSDRPLEGRLGDVIAALPSGMLYPEITGASVEWDGRSLSTPGFRPSPWMMSSPIRVGNREAGVVRVALSEERPSQPGGEGPFLAQERELLDAVAQTVSDAMEREGLHATVHQAQKIQTVGRLAGGIAHDFNNLLTVIQGHAELALEACPEDSELREELGHILDAAVRGSRLTSQLLAFSRRQVLEERTVDLADVVTGMEPMIRRLVPSRIDLVALPAGASAPAHIDRAKLEQVMLNLVVNAVDAIGGHGRIELSTRAFELTPQAARGLGWGAVPGQYASVAIRDTGTGMTPEVQDRMFEPFFTTKPVGSGTGLGLSMAYGFVKQSGGHILVDSHEGAGSTFELIFPLSPHESGSEAQASTTRSGRPRAGAAVPAPAAHILLVDDSEPVRRVVRQILERAGHRVTEAADGAAALELLRGPDASAPDLVISDVVMPRVGGAGLLRELRVSHPGTRVLLVSGHPRHEVTDEVLAAASAFLPKPFSATELDAVVRSILEQSGEAD